MRKIYLIYSAVLFGLLLPFAGCGASAEEYTEVEQRMLQSGLVDIAQKHFTILK